MHIAYCANTHMKTYLVGGERTEHVDVFWCHGRRKHSEKLDAIVFVENEKVATMK